MIAPAMAGCNPEDATYRDLGECQATLARKLEGAMLPRLAELGQILQPVDVKLSFTLENRKPRVTGQVRTRLSLPCQWCSEHLERDIEAHFSVWLALDEEQADAWDEELGAEQVVVVAGEHLDVPELVEDELLLSVPTRVCVDDACIRRPRLQDDDPAQTRLGPFAGMADLIRKH
jgi:uncharacterized metal-binding protein YceD (DUF177 family)